MAKQTLSNGESGLTVRGKINDNFTEVYGALEAVGSGGGTVQLPVATYTTGAIAAGKFTASGSSPAGTAAMVVARDVVGRAGDYAAPWPTLPLGTAMVVVSPTGVVSCFGIIAVSDGGSGDVSLGLAPSAFNTGADWEAGKYSFSFIPAKQTADDVGLGNVDNTSDASKPVSTAQAAAIAAAPFIGGSTGSTDNAILRADGSGESTAQGSGATIDDSGNVAAAAYKLSSSIGFDLSYFGLATLYGSELAAPGAYFHGVVQMESGCLLGWRESGTLTVSLGYTGHFLKVASDGGTGGGIELAQVSSGGTPSSNSARFYAKDVGGTAEAFAMDEAGVETPLTGPGSVLPGTFNVATLPSASTYAGSRAIVTDALAPTFGSTVAGSGAVITPVFSDGTNWIAG